MHLPHFGGGHPEQNNQGVEQPKQPTPSPREVYSAIQQNQDQLSPSPVAPEVVPPGLPESPIIHTNMEPTGGINTPEPGADPVASGPKPMVEPNYDTNVFGEPVFKNQPGTDTVINEKPVVPQTLSSTESGNIGSDTLLSEVSAINTHEKLVGDDTVPSLSNETSQPKEIPPAAQKWVEIIDRKIEDLTKERDRLKKELEDLDANIQAESDAKEAFMNPEVGKAVEYMKKNEKVVSEHAGRDEKKTNHPDTVNHLADSHHPSPNL